MIPKGADVTLTNSIQRQTVVIDFATIGKVLNGLMPLEKRKWYVVKMSVFFCNGTLGTVGDGYQIPQ